MNVKIFKKAPTVLLQFSPNSTKLHGKHRNQEAIQAVTFFGDLPKIKNLGGTLNFLTDHMGLEISKCYSYSFHPMEIQLYEDIAYHGGIQTIASLATWPSFNNFVAL